MPVEVFIPWILQFSDMMPFPEVVVESRLCCRGPEVDGKGGNGDITHRLLFHKLGLKRKERAVVGTRSITGLRKLYYFVLLLLVFKDGRDLCVFRG